MALTRPRLGQLYSNVAAFSDPITTLHAGATSANVDVGFLFNRANGLVSNVALVWKESTQSFIMAYTDATGVTDVNVTATSYANVTTGNITASGFFFANGAAFTSSSYGNTNVGQYLPTYSGNIGSLIVTAGTTSTGTNTGALQVIGGAGISGNLYVGGNLDVTGTTVFRNIETVTTTEYVSTINATNLYASTIGNTGATHTGATLTLSSWANIAGPLVLTNNNAVDSLQITGTATRGGVGYHDFLSVTNLGGGTNINKWFRVDSVGTLQIINSAYNTNIFNLTDAGALTLPSVLTAGNIVTTNGVFWSNGTAYSAGSTYGNTQVAAYLTVYSGTVNADQVWATNNGGGTNFKVGDDAWIGDINQGNTIGIKGQQDATQGYIVFGNTNSTNYIGRSGSNPITVTGAFNVTGVSTISGNLVAAATTATTSTTAGSIVSLGGIGLAGNLIAGGYAQFSGVYNENSTTAGVFIGNAGSGTPSPRIGFFTGTTSLNWQIDNYGGAFRWFTPGVTRMQLDANGNLSVYSSTASTSTSTGALVVTGGVGIGGNAFVGNLTATGFYFANGAPFVSSSYGNTSVAAYLPTDPTIYNIQGNLGAYQAFGNANAASQATSLNTINANLGAYQTYANTSSQTINANLGAYQTYANTSTQTISANLGAYQTYANTSIQSINANLGAYQTYGNTNLQTINANVGAYESFANTRIQTHDANIGAFQSYANTNLSSTNLSSTTLVATNFSSSNVRVVGGTEAFSTATGALQVSGGVGVSGNLWVGGNLYVGNVISTTTSQLVVSDPLVYFQNPSPTPYNFDIGFYSDFIGGPVNAYGHTGLVRQQSANTWVLFSNVKTEPTATTITWSDAGIIYDALKTGDHIIANTTPSTSTATGALQIAGGAGIAGTLYIANAGDVSANIGSLVANAGSQQTSINSINANIGAYYQYANANLGTATTSISTLQANVGAYELFANASLTSANTSIQTISANLGAYQTYANTSIQTINANLGAYQTYANGVMATFGPNVGTLYLGNISTQANLGAFETYANTKIGTNTNSNLVVVATTTSTSTVTGALVVAGGVGLAGNIYVGNRVGYVWGANSVSAAYTYFNSVTNSIDTVFG